MIDVDAQNLAEKLVDVLCAVFRIECRAAITHADVEVAVGAEFDHSTIVVRVWLSDHEQDSLRGAGLRGVCRCAIFGDDGRSVGDTRVVDEEAAVGCEVRVEGKTQQPLFATRFHFRGDIEEDRGVIATRLQNSDAAGLFDDEQTLAAVGRVGDVERARQPGDDRIEAQARLLRQRAGREGDRQHECDHGVRA